MALSVNPVAATDVPPGAPRISPLSADPALLAATIQSEAAGDPARIAALVDGISPQLTPVQQGELARELDGTLASAPAGLQTRVGDPLWGTRVAGIEAQLQRESQLQRGVNNGYADDLAAAAAALDNGRVRLPQGSYRTATPPQYVVTESRNPLAVDTLSQRNAELTIRSLTGRINANNVEIQRLTAENTALSIRLGVEGVVRDNPQLRERIDRNSAELGRLVAENLELTTRRTKAINDARLQASRPENGNMYQAVADNAVTTRPPVIFINGVNTDVNRSALQAMELSALFSAPVHHVVNVSSMDKMISVGVDVLRDNPSGRLPDLNVTDQRLQQLMSGNRPAAATAANAILDQLLNGDGKVKIVGYSQGAAIGSEALRMVNDYLMNVRGFNQAQRAEMLGRVEFLGIGPAAGERHISRGFAGDRNTPGIRDIPELRQVDYRTLSDANDPIPQLLNVSNRDGSSTDRVNITRSLGAAASLASPTGILPHLSYFRSYMVTDPGSVYNPEVADVLHRWYAGLEIDRNEILNGGG